MTMTIITIMTMTIITIMTMTIITITTIIMTVWPIMSIPMTTTTPTSTAASMTT